MSIVCGPLTCNKCGLKLGSHYYHGEEVCERQQEINRQNLGTPCPWCENTINHKSGCPNKRSPYARF